MGQSVVTSQLGVLPLLVGSCSCSLGSPGETKDGLGLVGGMGGWGVRCKSGPGWLEIQVLGICPEVLSQEPGQHEVRKLLPVGSSDRSEDTPGHSHSYEDVSEPPESHVLKSPSDL